MVNIIIRYITDLIFIIIGCIYFNIYQIRYLGLLFILMGIVLFFIDFFRNDFKKYFKKSIKKEKNIKLRERTEKRIERNTNVIFALVISGVFATSEYYRDGLLGLSILLLLAFIYFFYDRIYLEKYMDYTNDLLKKNGN